MERTHRTIRRRLAVVLLVVAAGALAPGAAQARQTWFGSSLNHGPANAGSPCIEGADEGTPQPVCTRTGSFYPGFSGREKSPRTGRVIKVRVIAQFPGRIRFKVVRLRRVAADHKSGQAKTIATSRWLTVRGPASEDADPAVESFTVNLPVRKGDSVAIDAKENPVEYCSDGTPGQLVFRPVTGRTFRDSTSYVGCLLLVQARVRF